MLSSIQLFTVVYAAYFAAHLSLLWVVPTFKKYRDGHRLRKTERSNEELLQSPVYPYLTSLGVKVNNPSSLRGITVKQYLSTFSGDEVAERHSSLASSNRATA